MLVTILFEGPGIPPPWRREAAEADVPEAGVRGLASHPVSKRADLLDEELVCDGRCHCPIVPRRADRQGCFGDTGLLDPPFLRALSDHRSVFVLSGADYQRAVEAAFRWLVDAGFRVTVTSFARLGHRTVLTDQRHWLSLTWERQEGAIFISWGEYLPPGQFNDDPLRNPKPPSELLATLTPVEIEAAGRVNGEGRRAIEGGLHRLSALIQESGSSQLLR